MAVSQKISELPVLTTADTADLIAVVDVTDSVTKRTTVNSLAVYNQGSTGAVDRTQRSKNQDIISAFDFMTTAQIADVKARSLLVDVTAALNNAVTAGLTHLPAGSYLTSTAVIPPENSGLIGDGPGATIISCTDTDGECLRVHQDACLLADFTLIGPGQSVGIAGSVGIKTLDDDASNNASGFMFRNLVIKSFFDGMIIDSSSNGFLDFIVVTNSGNFGIHGLSSQGKWSNVSVLSSFSDGLVLETTTVGKGGASPIISGFETFANGGFGVRIAANKGLQLDDFFINNDSDGGILFTTNILAQNGAIANGNIQFCGNNPFSAGGSPFENDVDAPGIKIDSGAGHVSISHVNTFSNGGNDIECDNTEGNISDCFLQGAGQGGNNTFSIEVTNGGWIISNNRCDKEVKFAGGSRLQITGNKFTNNSLTIPTVDWGTTSEAVFKANQIFNNNASGIAIRDVAGTAVMRDDNRVGLGSVTTNGTNLVSSW